MNLYGLAFVVIGIIVFALLSGMQEPFGFLVKQFQEIARSVAENNVAYNTAVLVLVIVGLSVVGNWLFRRRDAGNEEDGDRRGNQLGDEANTRIPGEIPRQDAANQRRRA